MCFCNNIINKCSFLQNIVVIFEKKTYFTIRLHKESICTDIHIKIVRNMVYIFINRNIIIYKILVIILIIFQHKKVVNFLFDSVFFIPFFFTMFFSIIFFTMFFFIMFFTMFFFIMFFTMFLFSIDFCCYFFVNRNIKNFYAKSSHYFFSCQTKRIV